MQTSINKLKILHDTKNNIPAFIKSDYNIFTAYLAGIIDGDGHIKIKNNKDRIIPQCLIRITADRPLMEIGDLIEKFYSCKVHYYYDKRSRAVETCFYVSKTPYMYHNVELIPCFYVSKTPCKYHNV